MTDTNRGSSFVKGAAILGMAGLIVQMLGAAFRIPLANIIGDTGMGYYQTAYPIYIFLLVFSTNGAPAAISKLVSERLALGKYSEAHRVFKTAFLLMGGMGIIAFCAVSLGAKNIVSAVQNEDAYIVLIAIAPALLFAPIMSVFRGYFQGMQIMTPTAQSQIIEQLVRITIGLGLAVIFIKNSVAKAAAGATLGTSIGPVFGIIFLLFIYYRNHRKRIHSDIAAEICMEKETVRSIFKKLLLISFSITIGVSIMPMINMGDFALVMPRLQSSGYSVAEANALYGQLSGMVLSIINIPMALALSAALSLVPAISHAKSIGDGAAISINTKLALRISMIISIPCAFGFIALASPIMLLLYPLEKQAALNSANCLFILGFGTIFLCVAQTMAGLLQGLGRPALGAYGVLFGFALKCIGTYFLTAIPVLNINGAAISSVIAFIGICAFNTYCVQKLTGVKHDFRLAIIRPLLSGVIMYIVAIVVYEVLSLFFHLSIATLLSILIAAMVYVTAIVKLGAIGISEIESMPKGAKIKKFLLNLHVISGRE